MSDDLFAGYPTVSYAGRWDDADIKRMLDWWDSFWEKAFRKRSQPAVEEAKRLGCGFVLTNAHGGFQGAQLRADPNVPRGLCNIYQFDKPEESEPT